jgi:hypothetical protein
MKDKKKSTGKESKYQKKIKRGQMYGGIQRKLNRKTELVEKYNETK